MELVVPSPELELAFAHFYDDFAQNDRENADYYFEGKTDFSTYVQRLRDEAMGGKSTRRLCTMQPLLAGGYSKNGSWCYSSSSQHQ